MSVDYRVLLWKYLNHVGECEGSIFDPGGYHRGGSEVQFSDAELAAFAELADMKEEPEPEGEWSDMEGGLLAEGAKRTTVDIKDIYAEVVLPEKS